LGLLGISALPGYTPGAARGLAGFPDAALSQR
jgi:hypothetical protein